MTYEKSLLERLREEEPKLNVLFAALKLLKDPQEIKQFYQEYIGFLGQSEDPEVRKNPKTTADSNIGYALGYLTQETANRWFKTLPDVSHPILGRDIFSLTKEEIIEKTKSYIEQKRKK